MRDELPVSPGHVVGWRAWKIVVKREPRLYSLYFDLEWPTDDWLWAERYPEDGRLFAGEIVHGVCAARDRAHLASMHRYLDPNWNRYVEEYEHFTAIGEVALAGVIVPGERGYRAERARVLSVLVPYARWDLVNDMRRAYRVPVGLDNVMKKGGLSSGHRS